MSPSRDAMPRAGNHTHARNRRKKRPMPRFLIEISLAIALTFGAILASVTDARASELMVSAAFARASATPAAKSGAAYLSIVNGASEPDRLVSITTPAARSSKLHTTVMAGDVMKMEEAGDVEVPPGGTLEMKPGGLHVMLTGLAAPLTQGGMIEMTLRFERAGDLKVMVPIGSVAADGP